MREYPTEAIDRRFSLLDRYERRCIIRFLRESEGGRASIGDVASHLRKQEPTADKRDKVAIDLRHNHLPELATIEAIEYDSGSETVRYDGDELVDALLETTPETYASDS
jgi:hypothetical protein